jgi:hypothetical protein
VRLCQAAYRNEVRKVLPSEPPPPVIIEPPLPSWVWLAQAVNITTIPQQRISTPFLSTYLFLLPPKQDNAFYLLNYFYSDGLFP